MYSMIHTFLTSDDRKALKIKAQKKHMTMAGYVTEVLQNHIDEKERQKKEEEE